MKDTCEQQGKFQQSQGIFEIQIGQLVIQMQMPYAYWFGTFEDIIQKNIKKLSLQREFIRNQGKLICRRFMVNIGNTKKIILDNLKTIFSVIILFKCYYLILIIFLYTLYYRRMNWFCWCKPTTIQKIQQYHPNMDTKSIPKDKSNQQARQGRATQQQTQRNIERQISLLKPRNQFDQKSKEGFSIDQLRKNKQPDGVFKKIQKSNYEEILAECQKTQTPWKDPDFNYQQLPAHNIKSSIDKWQRITKQIPNCTLMKYQIKPNQIMQGKSNDCYFLSAVSAMAEREYRIKSLFGSFQVNKWGVYMCKLLYNGIYQQVVVDDYFPYTLGDKSKGEEQYVLYCSKPTNQTDIWVLVLEKCWAKLLGGYSKIQLRFNIESLWALTGSPVLGQFDTTLYKKDSTYSKELFDKLIKYHDYHNYLMTASVDYKFANKQFNITTSHSYSILGLFETKDSEGQTVRLVQMRNPFKNNKMPKLPYNFEDPFWDTVKPGQKDHLQFWRIQKQGQDGIFYVDWQNFIDFWTQISVSQINDNAHYLYDKVTVQKGKPIYVSVEINSNDDKFYLFVAQKGYIQLQNAAYKNITVLVAEVSTNFKGEKDYKYICSKSYNPNSDTIINYLYVDFGDKLRIGKYQVRIFARITNSEEQMVLGYYSSNRFTAQPIYDVNDSQFVSKTLLSRAKTHDFMIPNQKKKILKEKLVNANGWRCIENIFESNICYIAYHIQQTSQNQVYSIQLDINKEKSKVKLQGIWTGRRQLKLQIKKGEQALIPYSYSEWLKDQEIDPFVVDNRKLPNPTLVYLK